MRISESSLRSVIKTMINEMSNDVLGHSAGAESYAGVGGNKIYASNPKLMNIASSCMDMKSKPHLLAAMCAEICETNSLMALHCVRLCEAVLCYGNMNGCCECLDEICKCEKCCAICVRCCKC